MESLIENSASQLRTNPNDLKEWSENIKTQEKIKRTTENH